ncbi:dihydrolipoyl dehydrogenase [Burkholderia plantarii]|uniref:Dihydrolipoyl dehydrogenase n=1 Tax=Burkholderia plantarii TaxID=41899 RepID=A0A0B6S1V9_BURPL|nr:dihydrolipoyl dehydrogenase [Burkholderia plantarii]AJK48339.1 2-oxoisovalerate dehydrogenase, E3 component, dihydrolipoamide dehydrogenase LpdA [Burkholderia plantarii]ALK32554.1 dihydrolipoamide dehydrogenase [Burkholderia plantarii]WLE61635.1 dihydrolipoyl dehydrogenase [Burkholderia plantarii]GLZ19927.1 dihydrolipoyl dehydrogenase [Burkholderia plantarii]
MNEPITTTLLIVGAGPGGYVAAIRAAQLGVPTVVVERAQPGGTCLNIGCIPSKALIHAADEFDKARHYNGDSPLGIRVASPEIDIARTVAWKDGIVGKLTGSVATLLKRHGVELVRGDARVIDGKTVEVAREAAGPVRIRCEHLLLAAGSEPVALPSMPFGGIVQSSTEALSPATLPRRLVVVGAGYIGLELAIAYRKLGAEVSVVEAQERILPIYDAALTKPVAAALARLGITLQLGRKVLGLSPAGDAVRVQDAAGAETALPADRVLVAVGRRPRTQGWGLEALQLDRAGHALKVDDQCRTSMRNVWAIGDLAGEPMLAHRAMAQGEMVAEIVSGKRRRFMPAAIPAICFTDPEVVSVGLAPHDAAAPDDALAASFPLVANGRAMTIEGTDGFVRVVARRDDHRILGWQAVGRGVSELAAAFSQSLEMGARLEDVGGTIHAHPTLGEAVQEAALRALGHALHV